jgi:PKHD-type hydroxylase
MRRRPPAGPFSSPATTGTEVLVHVPGVLTEAQVARCQELMARAAWIDGRVTAGHQSAKAKDNLQIAEGSAEAREMGEMIVAALERSPLFITAALPLRVFPPLFNRYEPGMTFGAHVDNAVRQVTGTPFRIRTDLSVTLFLSRPEEYDGGELMVEDVYGAHSVKLPAGDLILYPATSLHRVTPVTRGARYGSFFWIQSMVRDDGERSLLFDLDMAINRVNQVVPDHPAVVALTSCYHNLLRRWADAS